ncbi:MAG: hypothetical protein IT385_31030 [Deltaproteobacteria bacterium]|nr:hypothetical protein [Deltaproteobacteria bacterium]
MAKATLQSIRELSDKLHNRWTREFAGKPRHSRDLAALEKLVDKAATLVRKAKQIPGDKGDELEKVVRERLTLYTTERDAIAEVKYVRTEVAEVHRLGLEIDRALAVWRRHFGGRDRRSRDLALLDQLIARLQRSVARLRELAPANPDVVKVEALDGVVTQLEVMKDERSEIDKAKRSLAAADRPGVLLAEAAQHIDRFRVHCGGQPRPTCSLAIVDAVVAGLRGIVLELRGLELSESHGQPGSAGPSGSAHAQALPSLEQQLNAFTLERDSIAKAIAETPVRERGGQLALVANRLFELYQKQFAGQSRATRDLKLLSDINDRLSDVAEQMATIDREHDEPLNRKNVPIVEERARRYEAEWLEIAKAKTQAAQAAAQQATKPGAAAAAKAPVPVPGIRIEPKG